MVEASAALEERGRKRSSMHFRGQKIDIFSISFQDCVYYPAESKKGPAVLFPGEGNRKGQRVASLCIASPLPFASRSRPCIMPFLWKGRLSLLRDRAPETPFMGYETE